MRCSRMCMMSERERFRETGGHPHLDALLPPLGLSLLLDVWAAERHFVDATLMGKEAKRASQQPWGGSRMKQEP